MRYGVCIGSDHTKIAKAKAAGFDYVETGFAMLANADETEYELFRDALSKAEIFCESANCFIPGEMKTTGDNIDYEALAAYIDRGMARGKKLGLETVVFGSGGSRSVPAGFSFYKAFQQLQYFLRETVSPIAEKYGITVVVEPLCDCNIMRTVKEGVGLAAAVDKANVKGLGDLFHMCEMADTPADIKDVRGAIGHAHIAEPHSRVYPTDASKYDYKSFTDALEYAGCPRCSVEAGTDDFDRDAVLAAKVLKG